MIDIIKQTPYEYSSQSRDYQVIARLYTAIFNYTKMYIDNMQVWNTDIDNKLTTLRARTLNFIPKYLWKLDDLEAITSCFKYLMRNKGTVRALEFCIDILLRVEGLVVKNISSIIIVDPTDPTNIIIRVPENLLTLSIVEDLVRYLLPAGLTYELVEYQETDSAANISKIYHSGDDAATHGSNYAHTHLIIHKGTSDGVSDSDQPAIISNTMSGKFVYKLTKTDGDWARKVVEKSDATGKKIYFDSLESGGDTNGE